MLQASNGLKFAYEPTTVSVLSLAQKCQLHVNPYSSYLRLYSHTCTYMCACSGWCVEVFCMICVMLGSRLGFAVQQGMAIGSSRCMGCWFIAYIPSSSSIDVGPWRPADYLGSFALAPPVACCRPCGRATSLPAAGACCDCGVCGPVHNIAPVQLCAAAIWQSALPGCAYKAVGTLCTYAIVCGADCRSAHNCPLPACPGSFLLVSGLKTPRQFLFAYQFLLLPMVLL